MPRSPNPAGSSRSVVVKMSPYSARAPVQRDDEVQSDDQVADDRRFRKEEAENDQDAVKAESRVRRTVNSEISTSSTLGRTSPSRTAYLHITHSRNAATRRVIP